jgi:hypothetical protein
MGKKNEEGYTPADSSLAGYAGNWKTMKPYELTDYSVKFCVKTTVKVLMEKYILWERTINKEIVTMAATVDGGDLTWGLAQVSAGVKLADHKSRDPISGWLLFGESGHEKVQAKHNCFSHYIFSSKDNKELYQTDSPVTVLLRDKWD